MTQFRTVALSAAIGLSLVFGACTRKNEDGNLQVLYRHHQDAVKTWDPANAYDSISLDVVPSVYETLYQYDYLNETYKIVPLLAADMPKYSADRKIVTIPIRTGIKFQDDASFKATNGKGREMVAEDFVYEIKRLALPSLEANGYWIFDGKLVGFNDFHDKLTKAGNDKDALKKAFDEPIPGLKALDSHTLQLTFVKPYPALLWTLAMCFTSPVPHEAIDAYADEKGNLTDHPVGTGPFTLKTWDRERRIELVRNPNYHAESYPTTASNVYKDRGLLADAGKPLPFLDKVVINVTKEQQPAWLNFMSGKGDLITIPKDNFNQAIVNKTNLRPELVAKGVRLSIESGVTFYYVYYNMKDKLLGSNKALRQALSSAFSREKWIDTFTNGTGLKAVNALPPGTPDRAKNEKIKYDFDIARAKELLKKAGYPDGQGLPVINFDMRSSDSVARQLGEFFSQQFAQIGVKINVIYNTFPAYLEKQKTGNIQMALGGWGMDYPDAENAYQLLYSKNISPGPNDSNFQNAEFDKLYEEMLPMEPGPKRAAIVEKLDSILQEETPWALGYYLTTYNLTQPWVQNYRASDLILNTYKYYKIDKEAKKRYEQ